MGTRQGKPRPTLKDAMREAFRKYPLKKRRGGHDNTGRQGK